MGLGGFGVFFFGGGKHDLRVEAQRFLVVSREAEGVFESLVFFSGLWRR